MVHSLIGWKKMESITQDSDKDIDNLIKTPTFKWGFLFYEIFINMKKVIRLTERDLTRIVKRTIREMEEDRPSEYTADDAMTEIDSYINMVGCSEGKSRLLRDLSRMVDNAQRELSEEEFDKLMGYLDGLEQEIHDNCSDEEEDDEY